MPDAVETVRQGMQQETANELVGRKRHHLRLAVMPIILPAEGDRRVGDTDESGVSDCDAVGIPAEIGKHLCRATERRLGIDDPLELAQFAQPVREGVGFGEYRKLAEEAEMPSLKGGAQLVEEQAAEEAREDGPPPGTTQWTCGW